MEKEEKGRNREQVKQAIIESLSIWKDMLGVLNLREKNGMKIEMLDKCVTL